MFAPSYAITPELLANIKKITTLTTRLNSKTYPHVILSKLEREAREVSSFASTSIEGNPLPLTDVKKILKSRSENIDRSEREVINYNAALLWLDEELKKQQPFIVSHEGIHAIHALVMKDLLSPGILKAYRNEPVFVNDPRERKTIYWPPDHQDVTALIGDLIDFVSRNRVTIDPFILSGIFHKQFVIIHPFIDGNGRTVRLITKALLASMGLNTCNLFSFENYYNNNVTRYFSYVGELGNYYDICGRIDFTPWLTYFTEGIIDELLRVGKELEKESVTPRTMLRPYHILILDYIDAYGFITDALYSSLTKRAKATRHLDFKKLISMGILKKEGKGKATYYKRV